MHPFQDVFFDVDQFFVCNSVESSPCKYTSEIFTINIVFVLTFGYQMLCAERRFLDLIFGMSNLIICISCPKNKSVIN